MSFPRSLMDIHVSLTRRAGEALLPSERTRVPVTPEIGANDTPTVRVFFWDETTGTPVSVALDDNTDIALAIFPRNNVASDTPMWKCESFTKTTEGSGLHRTYYAGSLLRFGSVIAAYLAARDTRPVTLQIQTSDSGGTPGNVLTMLYVEGIANKDGITGDGGGDSDVIEDGGRIQ